MKKKINNTPVASACVTMQGEKNAAILVLQNRDGSWSIPSITADDVLRSKMTPPNQISLLEYRGRPSNQQRAFVSKMSAILGVQISPEQVVLIKHAGGITKGRGNSPSYPSKKSLRLYRIEITDDQFISRRTRMTSVHYEFWPRSRVAGTEDIAFSDRQLLSRAKCISLLEDA